MSIFLDKNTIKQIIKEHKYSEIGENYELWLEKILIDIIKELREEQEYRNSHLATKEDIKLILEKMDLRFELLQKEMNTRFENINTRFEAMQKENNARFELLQKEMNTRFENINTRFEAMQKENTARFEAIEKRFNTITWVIGLGFTMIFLSVALFNVFKS